MWMGTRLKNSLIMLLHNSSMCKKTNICWKVCHINSNVDHMIMLCSQFVLTAPKWTKKISFQDVLIWRCNITYRFFFTCTAKTNSWHYGDWKHRDVWKNSSSNFHLLISLRHLTMNELYACVSFYPLIIRKHRREWVLLPGTLCIVYTVAVLLPESFFLIPPTFKAIH